MSLIRILGIVALGIGMLIGCRRVAGDEETTGTKEPRTRTFLFTYKATITGVPMEKTARIWLPIPGTSEDQKITIISQEMPGPPRLNRETQYGNQILYVESKGNVEGSIPLEITYRVKRREVIAASTKQPNISEDISRFLQPDAKVPIAGKPLTLIEGKDLPQDQMAAARMFYDIVNNHMTYKKVGTEWGRGDAVWACESGYGNCSDFHSLFISLARSRKIPAKFEIGFPLPDQRGGGEIPGYHCWAKFRPDGKNWIPVDISEANRNPELKDYYFGNLTENRVTFSTGRDLVLVPKQNGGPLNFFVYPYVEIDGNTVPADKIQKKFIFKDVAGKD